MPADIDSVITSCARLAERLMPDGTGHAVSCWPGIKRFHACVSYISDRGVEESCDVSGATVYAAVAALEGWLEDRLIERREEVA